VPLTTVRHDKYALGYQAGDLLLKEIGERDTHEHSEILLPPELIVRASTAGAGR
jgi:LacI family transcriptional regulator